MADLVDCLVRHHGLDFELVSHILAAPFWSQIEFPPDGKKGLLRTLRIIYGSALVNGPFSIISANRGYVAGLNHWIKLRALLAAEKGDFRCISSEEAAIRAVCPGPDRVWISTAARPTRGRLKTNGQG